MEKLAPLQTTTDSPVVFGVLPDGREVKLFTLRNAAGMRARISEFGAAVVSLEVPDRSGRLADIVLGYDTLEGYFGGNAYMGAIVGRCANRIGMGRFVLDGKKYQLALNDFENHLHGGKRGFDKVLWRGEVVDDSADPSVRMTYVSEDGEEGYPGRLKVTVVYTLTARNELCVKYHAETDRPTIINLSHHSYFNLSGDPTRSVLDHELTIGGDWITVVNTRLIPSGEIASVEGTPFDFRLPVRIGKRIDDVNEQLEFGRGYDHNWVLDHYDGNVRSVATLFEPVSGRQMELLTDQPGLQFYSGNHLSGGVRGKGNIVYRPRAGLCLEAQHFPDSPNKTHFPPVVLRPGQAYNQTTIHRFSFR